jgi:ABC-type polysaccharide transport system permease subunit
MESLEMGSGHGFFYLFGLKFFYGPAYCTYFAAMAFCTIACFVSRTFVRIDTHHKMYLDQQMQRVIQRGLTHEEFALLFKIIIQFINGKTVRYTINRI